MNLSNDELLAAALATNAEQKELLDMAITSLKSSSSILDKSTLYLRAKLEESITDAATNAKKTIDGSIKPIFKWLAIATTVLIIAACVLFFGVYGRLVWLEHEIDSKSADVAELEKNVARLEKLNGHIKIETCENRPCVEVDTKHAYGDADSRYKFFGLRGN